MLSTRRGAESTVPRVVREAWVVGGKEGEFAGRAMRRWVAWVAERDMRVRRTLGRCTERYIVGWLL